jgi:hypothetical protein
MIGWTSQGSEALREFLEAVLCGGQQWMRWLRRYLWKLGGLHTSVMPILWLLFPPALEDLPCSVATTIVAVFFIPNYHRGSPYGVDFFLKKV